MTDLRSEYIAKVVQNKSFVDVGALWGIRNEKLSVAYKAGAHSLAIIDKFPASDPLWAEMRSYLKEVPPYEEIVGDVCDAVGNYDVVSCGGVIYHYPEPKKIIAALKSITKRYLIVTTTFTENHISNAKGQLNITESIYLPNIDDHTREIVKEDWKEFLSGKPASGLVYVSDWQQNVLDHWWWLFTQKSLETLFVEAGFKILESGKEGKTITFLLRKNTLFL